MARNTKDTAASVHQRLLNNAMETSRPFNELLQHFAIERFIYRLFSFPRSSVVTHTSLKTAIEDRTKTA